MIVVDTSPFFTGPMLATLDRTDELLLLCGLDVLADPFRRLSLQTLEAPLLPDRAHSRRLEQGEHQRRDEAWRGRSGARAGRALRGSPATGRFRLRSIGATRRRLRPEGRLLARSSADGTTSSASPVKVQSAGAAKQSLAKAS